MESSCETESIKTPNLDMENPSNTNGLELFPPSSPELQHSPKVTTESGVTYRTVAELDSQDPSSKGAPFELMDLCNSTTHLLRATIAHSLKNSEVTSAEDVTVASSINQKLEDLEKSLQESITSEPNDNPSKMLPEPSSIPPEDTLICEKDLSTTSSETYKVTKKNQKASNSSKKKGEKTAEQVLKSLGNGSAEEKLHILVSRYLELLDSERSAESQRKALEQSQRQVLRERDQLQAEVNRALLTRSRLESLCRELQRQNKDIKEESLARAREEEEKRKETAAKFQNALQEIAAAVRESQDRNTQLREENRELGNKLRSLVEHCELSEKHMEKVVRQKEVEAELHKARLAQAGLEHRAEKEEMLRDKQRLLLDLAEIQQRSVANESRLRAELDSYSAKYDEFQFVLAKSNDVFASFKKDMDNMTKKIKKLEKETTQWKARWEKSNATLMEMAADKQRKDKELIVAQTKVARLEKLCRALQAERNMMQKHLDGLTSCNQELSSNKCVQDADLNDISSINTEVSTNTFTKNNYPETVVNSIQEVSSCLTAQDEMASCRQEVSSCLTAQGDMASCSQEVSSSISGQDEIPSCSQEVSSSIAGQDEIPSCSQEVSSSFAGQDEIPSCSQEVSSSLAVQDEMEPCRQEISSSNATQDERESCSQEVSSTAAIEKEQKNATDYSKDSSFSFVPQVDELSCDGRAQEPPVSTCEQKDF